MARIDLSKLKEQALKAVEKSAWGKAAELYQEIARLEPNADWRQRAGEALRKAGDSAAAIEQFMSAAEGYAQGGFLLKAIAVCKVVLKSTPSTRRRSRCWPSSMRSAIAGRARRRGRWRWRRRSRSSARGRGASRR